MSTDADKAGRFLSVVEVAEELGVSTKHIRRAIDRGELPAHRFAAQFGSPATTGCCSSAVIET
jgi:excisionase family DNA binding protein